MSTPGSDRPPAYLTADSDPRTMIVWARNLLDETWTIIAQSEDRSTVNGRNVQGRLQAVQAMAALAQASALLMPTPEEVLAAQGEVREEMASEATAVLAEVYRVLDEGRRHGPRHPSLLAALRAIEDSRLVHRSP